MSFAASHSAHAIRLEGEELGRSINSTLYSWSNPRRVSRTRAGLDPLRTEAFRESGHPSRRTRGYAHSCCKRTISATNLRRPSFVRRLFASSSRDPFRSAITFEACPSSR